jgi:hypothetical protein
VLVRFRPNDGSALTPAGGSDVQRAAKTAVRMVSQEPIRRTEHRPRVPGTDAE